MIPTIQDVRGGVFPSVIWLVPDDQRARQLHKLIAGLPGDERRLHLVALHHGLVAALLRPPPS